MQKLVNFFPSKAQVCKNVYVNARDFHLHGIDETLKEVHHNLVPKESVVTI